MRGIVKGKRIYNTAHWKQLKEQFTKKGRCAACGDTDENVEYVLHHKHYRNAGNERPEDVEVLCRNCHTWITFWLKEWGNRSFSVEAIVNDGGWKRYWEGYCISMEMPLSDDICLLLDMQDRDIREGLMSDEEWNELAKERRREFLTEPALF